MRRIVIGVVAVLAAVLPLVFLPRPAVACLCTGHTDPDIEFEGEAVAARDQALSGWQWRFRVISGRGVANGDTVDVILDVTRPSESGDGWITSSCGVGDAPTVGEKYHVGASKYEGRYFAAQCSGYLRTAAPPGLPTEADEVGSPLLAAASATLAAAGALVLRARRP